MHASSINTRMCDNNTNGCTGTLNWVHYAFGAFGMTPISKSIEQNIAQISSDGINREWILPTSNGQRTSTHTLIQFTNSFFA